MPEKKVKNRLQVEFICLENLVPQDHLLRKIDSAVDFDKIYEFVEELYCNDNGRPNRGLTAVKNWVRLKFAAMNLKKFAIHKDMERKRKEGSLNYTFCFLNYYNLRLYSEKPENKAAIATGSTSGIGVGIAKLYATEGAKVVICGRRQEIGQAVVDSILKGGGEASCRFMDITDTDRINKLFEDTAEKYGKIDILVNNAENYMGRRFFL